MNEGQTGLRKNRGATGAPIKTANPAATSHPAYADTPYTVVYTGLLLLGVLSSAGRSPTPVILRLNTCLINQRTQSPWFAMSMISLTSAAVEELTPKGGCAHQHRAWGQLGDQIEFNWARKRDEIPHLNI